MSCAAAPREVPSIDYSAKDFSEVAEQMKVALADWPAMQDFGVDHLPQKLVTLDDYSRWVREPFRDKDLMFELALGPREFTEKWRALMANVVPVGTRFDLEFREGQLCATVHVPGGGRFRVWAGPEDADCYTEEVVGL